MFQKILLASVLVGVFYGLTSVKARRCSEMLKDQPCVVVGKYPLTLRCDHQTGKFFKIRNVSVEYRVGVWTTVADAQASAYTECRNNRSLDTNLEYFCSLSERSLCPYADRMRNVQVKYFCWELDPELLKGFGTRRR